MICSKKNKSKIVTIEEFKKIYKSSKNQNRNRNNSGEITFEECKKFQKQGALIIDVRSKQEYEEVHIQGAICIPIYELEKHIDKLPKDKKIVVYCTNGARSKRAQMFLKSQGYMNVYNLVDY